MPPIFKRISQPENDGSSDQNDSASLEGPCNSNPPAGRPKTRESRQKIKEQVESIAGGFTHVLGTLDDYEVKVEEPQVGRAAKALIRGIKLLRLVPKQELGDEANMRARLEDLIAKTRSVLLHRDLTLSDVREIIVRVRMRIRMSCELYYLDQLGEVDLIGNYEEYNTFIRKTSQAENIAKIRTKLPELAEHTLAVLDSMVGPEFVEQKIENEIKGLSLAAKFIHIHRQRATAGRMWDEIFALDRALRRLIRQNQAEDLSELDSRTLRDQELDAKRQAEGKLSWRQIMALLSGVFPEFSIADNTKKAAFIVAISPYESVKRIGNEFSYLHSFAGEHSQLVKHWRNQLKNTKRGRPRKNNLTK